jgi:hypothetical protein
VLLVGLLCVRDVCLFVMLMANVRCSALLGCATQADLVASRLERAAQGLALPLLEPASPSYIPLILGVAGVVSGLQPPLCLVSLPHRGSHPA